MAKNLWRIALTEAGLTKGFLVSYGVPAPTNTYKAFSATVPKGDGGNTRHGHKNDTWQFTGITPTQVYHVFDLVDSAITGTGLIYLTLPRADGENGGGLDWVDVSAVPHYPEIRPTQGGANGLVLMSVTIKFNNITIINAPSTAVPS